MNIFLPSIISMGNYRHILIEFAVPEWITALVYHATGPTLLVDRLVSIAFFLGSAYFLFRIVSLIKDRLLAWVAVLIYMAAPLGVYLSRAVHIDSAALCFGHALLYYFLRYGDTGRRRDLICATVASALGLLVKAPYVFLLILPALFVQLVKGQRRRAVISAAAFGAALAVGVTWYLYAQSVNRLAPDLSFVRGYRPPADRLDIYIGDIARRFRTNEWITILTRLRREIAVNVWWVLALSAVIWRRQLGAVWNFAAVWTLASLVFMLLFFAASAIHNYYQLPFIAPFALWMAMPLYWCLSASGRPARLLQPLGVVLLVSYCATGVGFAFQNYYDVDGPGLRVGHFVHARTTDRDLVIMAFNNATAFDPRYLYYAGRRGWSVRAGWLEPADIEGLAKHGATAVVTSDRTPAPAPTVRYLESLTLVGILDLGNRRVFLHRLR